MGAEPQGPRPGRLSPRSLYGSCTALAASAPSIFRMESRSHTSVAKAANPIQLSSVPPPPRHPFRRTRTDSAAVIGAASAVASERSLLAVKPPSGQAVSGILAASTDGVAGSAAPHAMPLDVGVQSQQGKSPYKNVNQDRWTAVRADGIELYGVFDGTLLCHIRPPLSTSRSRKLRRPPRPRLPSPFSSLPVSESPASSVAPASQVTV